MERDKKNHYRKNETAFGKKLHRVDSWWLSDREGTNVEERHGDKICRHLQAMDGGEKSRHS